MKKPRALNKGDTIGIISPAGSVKGKDKLLQAVNFLENKGFKVKLAPNVFSKEDYFAGSDELRLTDLVTFFQDKDIKAILCSRGGYGCARLLDKIDYSIIEQNPKIFLGYSDITAFLVNFPLVTFHSPMALADFGLSMPDQITQNNFLDIMQGVNTPYVYGASDTYITICPGEAEGELIGGNLSVLTSLLGTPYEADFEGKILLLEDINEPLYKIDRMMTHLKLAGVFEKIKGLIIADFSKVNIEKDFLKDLVPKEIPAFYGFHSSHEKIKYTLPMNVKYRLNADLGTIVLLEDYINK